MPTDKPRITFVMEEASYNTYKRFKALTNKSIGSLFTDVADQMAPMYDNLCDLIEKAQQMDQEARQEVLNKLDALQRSFQQSITEAQQEDWVGGRSVKKPSKAKISKPGKR